MRRRAERTQRLVLGLVLGSALWCGVANAEPARSAASLSVSGTSAQHALDVRLEGDAVLARVCAASCDGVEATELRPPASAKHLVATGRVSSFETTAGRRVGVVELGEGARRYEVWVAAPVGKGPKPVVLFSGWVGKDGERWSKATRADAAAKIDASITTHAMLCGREVLVGSKSVDPRTLALGSVPAPDPIGSDRAGVRATQVAPAPTGEPSPFRLLAARVASSGKAAHAFDGDLSTTWREEEPGAGTYAFVVARAPAEVPLRALDVTTSVGGPLDRAPQAVTIVTDAGRFAATLPAPTAGAVTTRVTFPAPIRTGCLAVVVDAAHGGKKPGRGEDAALGVAEVAARTALDGRTLDDVALDLGKADAARVAESVLASAGDAGVAAARGAYLRLDEPGRDRARRLLDAASCEDKLPLYVELLADRAESERARDRVRRCGKVAVPALVARMRAARGAERGVFGEEAALLGPDVAVPAIAALLGDEAVQADPLERRALRKAMAKAAQRESAARAFDQLLGGEAFARMPVRARVDVLRSVGEVATRVPAASPAFASVAQAAESFADRYLLVPPAGPLARAGDAGAIAFLRANLGDARRPWLRARAAEHARGVGALSADLGRAVRDDEVRVREAALRSLAGKAAAADVESALERVEQDPWTFVRLAALDVLLAAPRGAVVDARLGARVDHEPMPRVRAALVEALGARGATAQADVVRARALDPGEAVEVRLRALEALGALCDHEALDDVTALAERGRAPFLEADRKLSLAALGALGRLAPADLAGRLAWRDEKSVPEDVRQTARVALSGKGPRCKK